MEQRNAMVPFGQQVLRWAKSALVTLGSIALGVIAQQWAAMLDSHPWSLYQAAKTKDIERLRVLLDKAPRGNTAALDRWRQDFLEAEDILSGWSPLMVAASVGSGDAVQALLSAGARHCHTDRWERSALHLAVAAGKGGVPCAQLLLHAGADPFVEDCKGFTPYDLSLSNDSGCAQCVSLVRLIERRALFASWVNLKVARLCGLRRVWEPRWLVISPRRHSPSTSARASSGWPGNGWVVLCWFRSKTDFSVCGKAWLNGAEAHVVESHQKLQLTVTLERGHDQLQDAFLVADTCARQSFFLRGADDGLAASDSAGALNRIASLVVATNAASGVAEQVQSSSWEPSPAHTAEEAADRALAQRLQEEEYLRGSGGEAGLPSHVASSSAEEITQPSAPSWPGGPNPDSRTAHQEVEDQAQGRVRYPGGGTARFARPEAPPASAPIAGPSSGDDDLCVICAERPAVSGFLHGSSIHKCVCKACAAIYMAAGGPKTCPLCRAAIQQVVLDIY